jgi:hypothetical protein
MGNPTIIACIFYTLLRIREIFVTFREIGKKYGPGIYVDKQFISYDFQKAEYGRNGQQYLHLKFELKNLRPCLCKKKKYWYQAQILVRL